MHRSSTAMRRGAVPDGLFLRELMTLDLASPDAMLVHPAIRPPRTEWQDRQPLADAYGAAGLSWEQFTRATIDSIKGLSEISFYAGFRWRHCSEAPSLRRR